MEDHLDASCFLLHREAEESEYELFQVVDSQQEDDQPSFSSTASHHHGQHDELAGLPADKPFTFDEVYDFAAAVGRQTIRVQLDSLPSEVDAVYFASSVRKSEVFASLQQPTHRLLAAGEEVLSISPLPVDMLPSQSWLVCCALKEEGRWQVHALLEAAEGNAVEHINLLAACIGHAEREFDLKNEKRDLMGKMLRQSSFQLDQEASFRSKPSGAIAEE